MKESISRWQLTNCVIGFLLGTSILIESGGVYAKQDTWIAEFCSILIGMTLLGMLGFIVRQHPGMDVGAILDHLFGPVFGRLIMAIFVVFAFLLGILVLNNIGSFMVTMLMQNTPFWVFTLTIALGTGFILRYGIEVVVRCIEILIPIVLAVLTTLFVIVTLLKLDLQNLTPFFQNRPVDILKATITIASFPYAETVLLFFLAVLLRANENVYTAHFSGMGIGGLILLLRPIYTMGVFGIAEANRLVFPIFMMVRQVQIGNILERVELSIVVVWFYSTFIKFAICLYATVKGLQYIFQLKDYRPLALPLTLLMAPVSLLGYSNFQETAMFIMASWPLIVLPTIGIVFLMFILTMLKKQTTVA